MKPHLFILAGMLVFSGCSLLGEERVPVRVDDVLAESVELIDVAPGQAHFRFEGITPSPCYEYEAHETEVNGQRVQVRVRARSTSAYCIAILGRIEVEPLVVLVPAAGRYTVAFWRGDADPLEIEVDIP